MNKEIKRKVEFPRPDYGMCDGFGRQVDEKLYWRNTGLSQSAIARIKQFKKDKLEKE